MSLYSVLHAITGLGEMFCVMTRVTKTWIGHNSKIPSHLPFLFLSSPALLTFPLNKENISGPIFSNPQYFSRMFFF